MKPISYADLMARLTPQERDDLAAAATHPKADPDIAELSHRLALHAQVDAPLDLEDPHLSPGFMKLTTTRVPGAGHAKFDRTYLKPDQLAQILAHDAE